MPSNIEISAVGVQELYRLAAAAKKNAYAPYSGCCVGAAIRLADGATFTGCNVENASYGGTICAERSAIVKAVSEAGRIAVTELMVVSDAETPWPPCGLCRQLIAEFGPHCVVFAANTNGAVQQYAFEDLYPHPFGPEQMRP